MLHIALVGQANTGKTTLFNRLTGSRQKVANYAGVTVAYKTGYFKLPSSTEIKITDLPGIYNFEPMSADETVTYQFLEAQKTIIDLILCVIDPAQLKRQINLVEQAKRWGKPILVVLNQMAQAQSHTPTHQSLAAHLEVPVLEINIKTHQGIQRLIQFLENPSTFSRVPPPSSKDLPSDSLPEQNNQSTWEDRIDPWVLHPVYGPIILTLIMAVMFQLIFALAEPIKDYLECHLLVCGAWLTQWMSQDSLLYQLINESFFGGIGTIFAFCPQILLLFGFIFLLEESGYLPRAVFLVDYLLAQVGLSGRAFIPLLSSFGCTIPSIMATRNIQNPTDRLITILILPLMTCSARLPIYTLLISAFIPAQKVLYGLIRLQGLILFGLYGIGLISALLVAFVMKHFKRNIEESSLLMELPAYRLPSIQETVSRLWEQLALFIKKVGSIILALTILLWACCHFPTPPSGATQPTIYYSIAGYLGRLLSFFFQPIGFNWQICIALIPGLLAREVAISALGTVYAIAAHTNEWSQLTTVIHRQWSLPTALSLLTWYVFAPQCLSTLTVIRRETGSWRQVALVAGYLFGLAYTASFFVYRLTHLCQ